MIVDCDRCEVRGLACGECVIGVLLGVAEPEGAADTSGEVPSGAPIVQLDAPERRAIDVLADQGLVPRLRLVAPLPRRTTPESDAPPSRRDAG
ncbi:MAG TPA: hypothetical protein VD813_09630 [Pseudonocardia sp.]|nr:hypothetical protein [Pseudonocardia sp.]